VLQALTELFENLRDVAAQERAQRDVAAQERSPSDLRRTIEQEQYALHRFLTQCGSAHIPPLIVHAHTGLMFALDDLDDGIQPDLWVEQMVGECCIEFVDAMFHGNGMDIRIATSEELERLRQQSKARRH
jgi:hypothetical protein